MQNYLYQDLYNLEDTHWWHIAKRRTVLTLIKKFNQLKQLKILDLGCGTGKNLEALSTIGHVFGIDSSSQAINFCKKRGFVDLSTQKAEHTNFHAESFDLITVLDVLEHTDDNKTLNEIHRILRQNGLIVITVPAFPSLWSKWDEVLHHKRRYTKKSLKKVLTTNGFQVLQISYMNSFLVAPVVIIRFFKSILFPKNYPSDFLLSPPLINNILAFFSKVELIFIKKGLIPFGLSLIVVAKKNGKNYT